jgi:hypothetical protein
MELELRSKALESLHGLDNKLVEDVAKELVMLVTDEFEHIDILHACAAGSDTAVVEFDVDKISGVFEVTPGKISLFTDIDGVERDRHILTTSDWVAEVTKWLKKTRR